MPQKQPPASTARSCVMSPSFHRIGIAQRTHVATCTASVSIHIDNGLSESLRRFLWKVVFPDLRYFSGTPRIRILPVVTSVGQKIDVKPSAAAIFWLPAAV